MPHTWIQALAAYRYPVDLAAYSNAHHHEGWFNQVLPVGDRNETMEFEHRFRTHCASHIEAWLEVVFWKMYSQAAWRNATTRRVEKYFRADHIDAESLWTACQNYVQDPSEDSFESFRRLFGFETPSIAIAATFPAFMNPDMYPMVDRRIAKWVGACMGDHNVADPDGPQLTRFPYLDNGRAVLTLADFDAMQDWARWCVHTSNKLRALTQTLWRARDVEMAVFTAWGRGRGEGPQFHLNPLGALEHIAP
jgi:hypothetical protein